MCRQRAVIVAARALGRGGHDVDARLEVTERLVDRKCRDNVLVQRGGGRQLARPHLDAALVAEIGELVAAQRALEVRVDHRVDQVAVADPEDVDRHRRRVDADHRDTALSRPWQHIGAPCESHEWFAVTDVDVELGRFRQGFLDGRWQAGAQIDVVALAVLQPVDAELLALRRQGRLVGAGQRQERREVDAFCQFLGELEASPR